MDDKRTKAQLDQAFGVLTDEERAQREREEADRQTDPASETAQAVSGRDRASAKQRVEG